MLAFGAITSFKQLYVFSFSSTGDTFDYALLVQHIPPPPLLQPILIKVHASWHLPSYLSPYVPLLKPFPTMTLIDDISSQVDPTSLFTPFGASYTPILLSSTSLLEWTCSLFGSAHDSPMWSPASLPRFTGTFPFLRHIQYWIHLHNKYQESHELPPFPFVLLSRFTAGSLPPSPTILFCAVNTVLSVDIISSSLCPHIFVPNTFTDLTIQHYGVVIGRPSELFFEFDPKAPVPHPIAYP